MGTILALLAGVMIALLCGGASWWLATAMWRSRTETLMMETETLHQRQEGESSLMELCEENLSALRSMEEVTGRLKSELSASMNLLSLRQKELEGTIAALDTNVYKLIQLQTGEIVLAKSGVPASGWGVPKNQDSILESEALSALPGVLGLPT